MTEEERVALRDEVARTVMGWTCEEVSWAYGGVAAVWHDADGVPMLTRHAWQPDRDDAQAMRVLDRMVDLGLDYELGGVGGDVFAEFKGSRRHTVRAEGGDRRLTLLRAALAVLAEDPSP